MSAIKARSEIAGIANFCVTLFMVGIMFSERLCRHACIKKLFVLMDSSITYLRVPQ